MPYPLPLTRTEAYLAYKAGVIQQSDLKPSLAVPRNGIDAWLAYWTGLAADYPKREDGTPHILQEEEAYIAYLCGVINEYPEKCLRRVGAYLRYLISARWGRPDHPLNREELYLSLLKTQVIPSGDPSSNIVIDGTAKAPFQDVKMYGDTFQQTYTGKNLIDMPMVSGSRNGVTWVVNSDGSITLNGTTTASVNIRANTVSLPAVAGETYTLSATGLQNIVNFGYKNADSGANVLVVTQGSPVETKQITAEMLSLANCLDMFITTGRSFNNQRVTLQLEKGSTATDYEPYVGGQPSPNPEYPQPIQTVTGTQTVEITGKNLFNSSVYASAIGYNAQRTLGNDGSITWVNTTSDSYFPWIYKDSMFGNSQIRSATIPVQPSTQYTVSLKKTTATSIGLYIYEGDSDYVGIKNTYTTIRGDASYTFTTSETTRYVILRFAKWASRETDVLSEIQLEAGSTASSFAPYSKQTLPISLGSIELCKLGTYQDYIYKDGEDWKVHKELGNVTLDSTYYNSRYGTNSYGLTQFLVELGVSDYYDVSGYVTMLSNSFTKQTTSFSNTQVQGFLPALDSNSHKLRAWIRISTTTADTIDQFKAWLNTNTPIFYYKLNTATDTTITDTNLIAQLEALVNGGAEEGTTYIKVNATDPNLPGLLYVEAPKYE